MLVCDICRTADACKVKRLGLFLAPVFDRSTQDYLRVDLCKSCESRMRDGMRGLINRLTKEGAAS